MNTGWLFCPWTARRPPVSALDAAFHGFCKGKPGKDDAGSKGDPGKVYWKIYGAGFEVSGDINCHHNYASLETHYGKEVWVHRKRRGKGRKRRTGGYPGAMGSYSYVVMGKGNQESFCSCSHGAGRKYSRKGAMEAFPVRM